MADAKLSGNICKVDEDRRNVFGWAYLSKQADGTQVVDHSGDIIDDDALPSLEDAVYRYAKDVRSGDVMHETFGVSQLIESFVLTKDKADRMGLGEDVPTGVWVGYHFPPDDGGPSDEAWGKVKSGELKAFSIVGSGRREDI